MRRRCSRGVRVSKYLASGEADGYLWELSGRDGKFSVRSCPLFEVGDIARLTGNAWEEIERISPIAFERIPKVGEEHVIAGHSPLGAYFDAYGERWAVNWTYTAEKVGMVDLIGRSSLGAPEAQALSKTVSDEKAAALVAEAHRRSGRGDGA